MSLQNFLDENHIGCIEGDRGVAALNTVCKELGYRPDGFLYGSSLENFLKDNTGATQALLDWIEKNYSESFSEYKDEEDEGAAEEDAAEENRRDEKHGLYPEKTDIAN